MRNFAFFLFITISISLHAQKPTIEDLFINDRIPAKIKLDELISLLKIDSIVIKPEYMDAIDPDSLVYIGESYFYYYKGNNNCYLSKVAFNDKIKSLRIDEYVFDKQSTYDDIKSAFSSCSALSDGISIYNDPLNYESCRIDIEDYDGSFLFFFHEKMLKLFFVWQPV